MSSFLEYLSRITNGELNRTMASDEMRACPTYSDIIETKTHIITPFNRTIDFTDYIDESNGIANIRTRILKGGNNWSYYLTHGQSRLDNIYNGECPWMCRDNRAIPFAKYHNFSITFDIGLNSEIEVTYDIVKITPIIADGRYTHGVVRNSEAKYEFINGVHKTVKLKLGFPTYGVSIKTEGSVAGITLKLSDAYNESFTYDKETDTWNMIFDTVKMENGRIIVDTKCNSIINFTSVNPVDIAVQFEGDIDNTIKFTYWHQHWNGIVRCNGLTGFSYGCE